MRWVGFIALTIGAALWAWHGYWRALDPAALLEGAIPPWLFISYTLLTQIGLALIGIFFVRSEIISWVGWLLIAGTVVSLLLFLVLKDVPPFVYSLLTLITGVMLFRY